VNTGAIDSSALPAIPPGMLLRPVHVGHYDAQFMTWTRIEIHITDRFVG
jgi:hypothetical protein